MHFTEKQMRNDYELKLHILLREILFDIISVTGYQCDHVTAGIVSAVVNHDFDTHLVKD